MVFGHLIFQNSAWVCRDVDDTQLHGFSQYCCILLYIVGILPKAGVCEGVQKLLWINTAVDPTTV